MSGAAQGITSLDWLAENSQRRYPLHEDAGLRDSSNSFSIPNDFIVDLVLMVHADSAIDVTLFHVISIGVFGSGVSISIGYNGTTIGTVAIDTATFTRNKTFLFTGSGSFFDAVGKIVIGTLETVVQSAGFFSFDVANGCLEPSVIRPDIRGVSSVKLQNGTDVSDPIQDDIVLQAGRNFMITLVPPPFPGEPSRIVFNAISGEGLNQGCSCDEAADLPCVKTINGILPDNAGNFALLGDDCLTLDAISNGLQLKDECAKPCCGCTELDVLNTTLGTVMTQVLTLENLGSRLEQAIQTLQTNLLLRRGGRTE